MIVVYYAETAPLRTAISDHLYSIKRYGECRAIYINIAVRSIPSWISKLGATLVVYHTTLLGVRWHPPTFARMCHKLARLRRFSGTKVAIPQDEFIHTDALCEFIRDFGVDHVLTCADEADQQTIYGDLIDERVRFTRVLTGYIDRRTIERVADRGRGANRVVDIAYRAWKPEYWLGRHAQLKADIAEAFESRAPNFEMTTDISVRSNDTLVGDRWFDLLITARWTIGVEGGATILDRDGTLRERTLNYVSEHPGASFSDVEAACFPGRDGEIRLTTLSPRHLEACVTRTAQALIEGEYNGILKAGVHYLPLSPDLSNITNVIAAMRDDSLRQRLADAAYEDVVASQMYDYGGFAEQILSLSRSTMQGRTGLIQPGLVRMELALDGPSWLMVRLRARLKPALRRVLARTGMLGPMRALAKRGY